MLEVQAHWYPPPPQVAKDLRKSPQHTAPTVAAIRIFILLPPPLLLLFLLLRQEGEANSSIEDSIRMVCCLWLKPEAAGMLT